MKLPVEDMGFEQRHEESRKSNLRWNIRLLLDSCDSFVVPLAAREEDGRTAVIKVLGGSMQFEDHVRPAQLGLVHIDYPDLSEPKSPFILVNRQWHEGENTTISIDTKQYRVDQFEVRRIDEHPEDPNEEDAIQTALGVVDPSEIWDGKIIRWDPLLSRMKATEQLENHPDWS